ncbi:MAG: hypothetical protein FGM41_01910 [Bacteroidetes bacterium]|jgi:hypothetical protein|nr:hypothetical protein [Bacteroidota bacterium]
MIQSVCKISVLLLLCVSFTSCQKQYFHLNKVKANPKKGSFNLFMENKTPQLLTKHFEEEVKEACIKKLIKNGHTYTTKNPQYLFFISLAIDSVLSNGISYAAPINMGKSFSYHAKPYSRTSKGIYIEVDVKKRESSYIFWETDYDLYYFAEPKRDLKRTKGVMRYLIDNFKE